jgi:hypothetical protein
MKSRQTEPGTEPEKIDRCATLPDERRMGVCGSKQSSVALGEKSESSFIILRQMSKISDLGDQKLYRLLYEQHEIMRKMSAKHWTYTNSFGCKSIYNVYNLLRFAGIISTVCSSLKGTFSLRLCIVRGKVNKFSVINFASLLVLATLQTNRLSSNPEGRINALNTKRKPKEDWDRKHKPFVFPPN